MGILIIYLFICSHTLTIGSPMDTQWAYILIIRSYDSQGGCIAKRNHESTLFGTIMDADVHTAALMVPG